MNKKVRFVYSIYYCRCDPGAPYLYQYGLVSGCLMTLGLLYRRDQENLDNWQAYLNSLPPARKFYRHFEDELGSTMCGDIIEAQFGRRFDLADQREALEWMQCGPLEKCGEVIGTGFRIAVEIIKQRR